MFTESDIKCLWKSVMEYLKLWFPQHYLLLKENGYKVGVREKRNNTFGWASKKEKIAVINLFLHKNSTEDMVRDTMLHELAHCIDYCKRGTSDHGPKWQAIAKEIGATPKAKSKKAINVEYKYVCIYKKSDVEWVMLKGFHRKPRYYQPNQVMQDTFMKNHREESLGKVWLLPWDKYKEHKERTQYEKVESD